MKIGMKAVKGLYGLLAGMGIIGVVLFIALMFIPLIASIYGIVLAFKASILLGVIALRCSAGSICLKRSWLGSIT